MSFYDFNTNLIGEQLLPPALRRIKHLAWMKVILSPIQTFRDLFFIDYMKGASYPAWDVGTAYARTDRVIWKDKRIYECLSDTIGFLTPPTGMPLSTTFWTLIQDNFIGVEERIKYNGQMIILVYAINRWFQNPLPADQIYIENIPTFGTYQFTVFFPSALYTSLGATSGDRENTVRNFVDKYKLSGIAYDITTY